MTPEVDAARRRVLAALAEVNPALASENIADDWSLLSPETGLDSLEALQVLAAIEDGLGWEVDIAGLGPEVSVAALIAVIADSARLSGPTRPTWDGVVGYS